jgi:2-polyprenyl-6-methoxyphenol hydroxylase-like FAD-dependent oxidoreductase
MVDIKRILIVGGGIAGLSAASALARQGFSAELIERNAKWPAVGAGINLPANGVRVLQALGLGAGAERNAAVVRRWGFFDQHGAALCETDLEDLWSEVGPSLAMTRVKLR